jgi:cold shock CspA family protein
MRGIIKKFDLRGFGIIESADGSKLPFVRSDFARHQYPREGQQVTFSIRRVNDQVFASNVFARRDAFEEAHA